jgi:hypothetical protein
MKTLRIFVQGENLPDVDYIEVEVGRTVADFKSAWARKHTGYTLANVFVFAEGGEEPLGDNTHLDSLETKHGVRVHLHRCHRIHAKVSYAGRSVEHDYSPATTIAHIKKWAAGKLGLSPEDAAEHVLQVAGTQTRPDPDTHVGTLVSSPQCSIAFDLVPAERVNGCRQ